MSANGGSAAQQYLRDRFEHDRDALRARAADLEARARAGASPATGPDAAASRAMAAACDDVLAAVEHAFAREAEFLAIAEALASALDARGRVEPAAPVRAVFAGAAARVREMALKDRETNTTSPHE
jgi:hypothetical protein